MFSKMKKLNSQEWGILLLFILSIFCLILTVQFTSDGDSNSSQPIYADIEPTFKTDYVGNGL